VNGTILAMDTAQSARTLTRSDLILIGGGVAAIVLAGVTRYAGGGAVLAFLCSAIAVTLLAALVGRAVEQLGDRFGPGATGVLQSALGNLPELFIALFALKAGLVEVVQAALIGSILANVLLVLGLCFIAGGLKHGTQQLGSERARSSITLMVLSVAALVLPSLASYVHTPAAAHEKTLSLIVAIVLLLLFVLYLPASLRRQPHPAGAGAAPDTAPGTAGGRRTSAGDRPVTHESATETEPARWPLWLAILVLVLASGAAAFVSDWFVHALEPAMQSLHIAPAFAGLVIVAIAGNAIENVVGIKLALAGRSQYAFSVVINSPLQIALVLAPLLVVLSQVFGLAALTLVFSPMLVVSVVIAVILTAFITFDGESNWLEGAAMVSVYCIIAASFWWG